MEKALKDAVTIFKKHKGILKTKDALEKGIHPRTLYQLRDENYIEELSRGIFKLSSYPLSEKTDLITVSLKYPDSVICLISALSFHELTTEIPHQVYISMKNGHRKPLIKYPPVKAFYYSDDIFKSGIEEVKISGVRVKIYNPEKTLADCFKFRNKIGLDVCLEALKIYFNKRKPDYLKLTEYAKLCRVEKIMKPYLEMTV